MRHIIESQQFDQKIIKQLFKRADFHSKKKSSPLRGQVMASLFYEPSTRTRFSFEAAMLRLGGSVISTENAKEFSSAAKGETLEDSIKVISSYVDTIVLRHFEAGASARAAQVATVPIINAGDGTGQHPTQALLDLYTIKREVGRVHNLRVALVGDLKHGRTVRSLVYLLTKYTGNSLIFVSPPGLKIGVDIKEYLDRHGVRYQEISAWDGVFQEADVIYMTRVQRERFATAREYQTYKNIYKLTLEEVNLMKSDAIIMHPLPRVGEIVPAVDTLPAARYFQQAENGLYVRMALLEYVLGT